MGREHKFKLITACKRIGTIEDIAQIEADINDGMTASFQILYHTNLYWQIVIQAMESLVYIVAISVTVTFFERGNEGYKLILWYQNWLCIHLHEEKSEKIDNC